MSDKIYTIEHSEALIDSVINCPACDRVFHYNKSITVKHVRPAELGAEMPPLALERANITEAEGEFLDLLRNEGKLYSATCYTRDSFARQQGKDFESFSRSNQFPCPHCEAVLQLGFEVRLVNVQLIGEKASLSTVVETEQKARAAKAAASIDPLATVTEADRRMYAEWKTSGLLQLFLDAYAAGHLASQPKTPKRQIGAIRGWMAAALERPILGSVRQRIEADFPGLGVATFEALSVVGVLVDGQLRTFIPKPAAMGYTITRVSAEGRAVPTTENWFKTRFGYASGKGVFFTALQLESKAAMGNATKKQRGTTAGSYGLEAENE